MFLVLTAIEWVNKNNIPHRFITVNKQRWCLVHRQQLLDYSNGKRAYNKSVKLEGDSHNKCPYHRKTQILERFRVHPGRPVDAAQYYLQEFQFLQRETTCNCPTPADEPSETPTEENYPTEETSLQPLETMQTSP